VARELHAGERAFVVLHTPRQHPLRVVEHPARVGRVGRAVDELIGVEVEVEEDRRQHRMTGEVHVLAVVVAQHRERAFLECQAERLLEHAAVGITKVELRMHLASPVGRRVVLEPRGERPAVALQGHLGGEQLGDRREHVDVLGEHVDDAPA
jgi:hypothetical protein